MGRSSRDRDKLREKDKSRDRSRERDRYKDKDRDRDRDYYRSKRRSRSRSKSSSRSKSHYSSSSRSKKSKKSYRRSRSSSSERSSRSVSRSRSNKSRSKTREPFGLSSDKYLSVASTLSSTVSSSKPLKSLEILENRLTSTVLGSIEEDTFAPQAFVSGSAKKVSETKVYINLKNETMAIPVPVEKVDDNVDYNFNPQFLGDEQTKMEKWIKKLHNYRRREAFL